MPTEVHRMEFIGGPLDGAVRPVSAGCHTMPLAYGMIVHVYSRDEVFTGYCIREVMRHQYAVRMGATHDRAS